ncbi:hypothetical protein BJX68DRAFT_232990 [Aspergillus pseudodeflectus]|uniref:Uncharacterized protein n=1 Tax=Aspergillus pseudodeflectus TaxID=176178 RepID=A0ABR4KPH9_9EURO
MTSSTFISCETWLTGCGGIWLFSHAGTNVEARIMTADPHSHGRLANSFLGVAVLLLVEVEPILNNAQITLAWSTPCRAKPRGSIRSTPGMAGKPSILDVADLRANKPLGELSGFMNEAYPVTPKIETSIRWRARQLRSIIGRCTAVQHLGLPNSQLNSTR